MLLLVACTANAPPDARVELDSNVGTIAIVEWETPTSTVGSVRTPDGRATPDSSGTSHRHVVFGLADDTTHELAVVVDGEDATTVSVRTRAAPDSVPSFTLERGTWHGWAVASYQDLAASVAGIVVVNERGERVWWHEIVAAEDSEYATTALWDGGSIWFNAVSYRGAAIRVIDIMTGDVEEGWYPNVHHEFALLPDRQLAMLRSTARQVDGETVLGDQLVTGTFGDPEPRIVWDAWDTLEPERHAAWDSLEHGKDWTHANGLTFDPTTGRWIVSLYWLKMVLAIDDASGDIVATLDGDEVADPFGPQHSPEISGDGILLFDNELIDGRSRLLDIGWDGTTRWSWAPEVEEHALVLGDVDRLADGTTVSSWGPSGMIVALSPDSEEVWRVQAESGYILGQVDVTDTVDLR
jgi:hypothetical protein